MQGYNGKGYPNVSQSLGFGMSGAPQKNSLSLIAPPRTGPPCTMPPRLCQEGGRE